MDISYSPFLPSNLTILILSLLFFTSPLLTVAQQAMLAGPIMAQCGPRLLSMAPCAPFVEGRAPGPNLQCCESLKKVYNEQRDCLCLFLNGTALASLPINSTLALELPGLCSPQIDPSTCSASSSSGNGGSSRSPGSQATFKTPNASTAAAPPVDSDTAPTPSTVEFGMGRNLAYKLKTSHLGVKVAVLTLLLAKLL
ncbi:hypothetical protein Cgig2_005651 [Carnegiea gigantea]|uniref:Bifunctional inhibitor/plant lipid transfer protein/seed storage helical domain-containing protein n=1 Tax=Carnegiea gigantea TaxID=171969 RepID=A0A9Q1KTZ2_9CARY|nr:hypothetical protein Cgig2_005651 [Carnegiea gigantea]